MGLLFLLGTIELSGCHSSWLVDSSAPLLDNVQFMDAWKTYLHCRSSAEPDEISLDLQRLNLVAHAVTKQNHTSLHLPVAIRSLIAKPPSRLSVDPQAMAVACALHGGHVAQSASRLQLAEELFTAVVAAQEEGAHVYYVGEARRMLAHMQLKTPVTKVLTDPAVQVSSR